VNSDVNYMLEAKAVIVSCSQRDAACCYEAMCDAKVWDSQPVSVCFCEDLSVSTSSGYVNLITFSLNTVVAVHCMWTKSPSNMGHQQNLCAQESV
jgi:hypothetical protein